MISPLTCGSDATRAMPSDGKPLRAVYGRGQGGLVPVVFRSGSYRFFFYSDEGRPREAPHIHVRQGSDEAKFWLQPDVGLVYNDGFNA